jgi:hypothetical protein
MDTSSKVVLSDGKKDGEQRLGLNRQDAKFRIFSSLVDLVSVKTGLKFVAYAAVYIERRSLSHRQSYKAFFFPVLAAKSSYVDIVMCRIWK